MKDYYKPLYIVDASVIIKWIAKEDFSGHALKLRNDFLKNKIELGIPEFAYYEVSNYFAKHIPTVALLFLSQLFMLKMTEFRLSLKNSAKSISIMNQVRQISFYDASYHATAIENNGTFITADEKYYRRAKSFKHITLLKNYPISPQ